MVVAAHDDPLGANSRFERALDPGTYRLGVSSYDGVGSGSSSMAVIGR